MDFDLSDDQRLIKESLERLMRDRYAFDQRQCYSREPGGWSRKRWKDYAEIGILGLPFSESDGGLGATPVETMIVMEAFGRALVLEPFLATVILAGGILRFGGNAGQRQALVPTIINGDLILALAHHEQLARFNIAHVETVAIPRGAGWVLNGHKELVLHGDSADKLIVSARTSGNRDDTNGIALFLVDVDASGVSRKGYVTQDGLRTADISLRDVLVEEAAVISKPADGFDVLMRVRGEAIAALCAEAVGAMAALHELTVRYLKERRQFGVPIGTFQVLQHRAVDMLIALEQARSMALFATMMASVSDALERERAMAAAKVQIGRSGRFVGEQAIQLHGGMGMTMEYRAGHYFKRLSIIDLTFGDADHHLQQLAKDGGIFADPVSWFSG